MTLTKKEICVKIMKRIPLFTTICLFAALIGCGGGGGGGAPAVVNADSTGYYDITGTASVKDDTTNTNPVSITDLQGLVYNDHLYMFSQASGLTYDGPMSVNGTGFTANITIYLKGGKLTAATISGTINAGKSIVGTLTGIGSGNGSFTLSYAANNRPDAALATIQRSGYVWNAPIGGSILTFNLSFNSSGGFSGVGTKGAFSSCTIVGTFVPINNTHLYTVTATMTNCLDATASTNYSGLATTWTQNVVTPDDTLVMVSTDNGAHSMDGDFQ
jgi:hypothetical protein